jgi:adenine/guanine phosphoribosyltransferase-like PRPP-binding protein
MPVFLGYDRIEQMIAALLPEAQAWGPDEVVGIANGGIVPAAMAAGILALPLAFVRDHKEARTVSWIGPPASGRRVLLVDDCCSTGMTLRRARDAMLAEGRQCLTLVVVYDPEVARYLPDLSHPMRALFRLPWERGEATPTGRAAKASGMNADRSVEAPFTGFGLDAAALANIASSPQSLPPLPADRTVLISFLPEAERANITTALAGTVYADLPLNCRTDAADMTSMARFKAEAATRFGCTHFIDCDAAQAIAIAAHAPHLIVTWWSFESRHGWTVAAAMQPGPPR